MLIRTLTEEEIERVCKYYFKKYNNRYDLMFYDKHGEGPCANCPFSISPTIDEYVCGKYLLFGSLNEKDTAIAKGELNAN